MTDDELLEPDDELLEPDDSRIVRAPEEEQRIEFDHDRMRLMESDTLIVKKRDGGNREVPCNKWTIDRNTEVGEDADLYEHKPYGGKRRIPWKCVVAVKRKIP